MEVVHKTLYQIRDLCTRSVVLFPTRAQISRETRAVNLKPGTNEITIVGLTPTIEEESIKVEGSGSSAIITDIAVELLPNREIFEEVYPDFEGDCLSAGNDDDATSEDSDDQEEGPKLRIAKSQLRQAERQLAEASEIVSSSTRMLEILDAHGSSLHEKKELVDIQRELAKFKNERQQIFIEQNRGKELQNEVKHRVVKIKKQISKLRRQEAKEKAVEEQTRKKAKADKERRRRLKRQKEQDAAKEKARVMLDRKEFWPLHCYSVRITIESHAPSPVSSRWGSVTSEIDVVMASMPQPSHDEDIAEASCCDLVLSYVTTAAGWVPNYDLQLSTVNSTASLCFDAQVTNTTSETWTDCKVTLSTSQTAFGGLGDVAPLLSPWKIKLATKGCGTTDKTILKSSEEHMHYTNWVNSKKGGTASKPRREMFATDRHDNNAAHAHKDYEMQLMLLEQQNKKRLLKARLEHSTQQNQPDAQRGRQVQQNQMQQQAMLQQAMLPQVQQQIAIGNMGRAPVAQVSQGFSQSNGMIQQMQQQAPAELDFDEVTLSDTTGLDAGVDFEESLMAENGFTTTYDLPGLKTLVPKSASSKQRIARLKFSAVVFNHTVLAKYRPVASLKAKIRNSSGLTLLRGYAGLTLDGSFMGRTALPRCSAGDTFSLNLGADPAIRLLYSKPEVRRATTGIFSKENTSIYTRSLTLQNTKASAGKAVSIMVQDQVPVSEDERLRVELLQPRGVQLDGAPVASGEPARDERQDKDWGKGTALLKKGGEVNWQVMLNAGKAVRLSLEYAVSLPSGDTAMQCYDSWIR